MSTQAAMWPVWQDRIRHAGRDGGELRSALSSVAEEVAAVVGRRGSLVERWQRIGIDVRFSHQLRVRGRCDISDSRRVVVVRAGDRFATQSFTIAHEVAHLLMAPALAEHERSVGHWAEEKLCNRFAGDVLVPPGELAAELAGGSTPSPERVLRLCGVFQANPSVIVEALRRRGSLGLSAYLLARLRGHYRRPTAVDFRIDAAAGPPFLFWPRGRRLRSLGLVNLASVAAEAAHGACMAGWDERTAIPRRRLDEATGDNAMTGPIRWQAIRQGRDEPYVVTLIDCAHLRGARLRGDDWDAGTSNASPPTLAVAAG